MKKEIRLDFDRIKRTGLGEAVMCKGKSLPQMKAILAEVEAKGEAMLFTRLNPYHRSQLSVGSGVFDYDQVSRTAFYLPDVGEKDNGIRDKNIADEVRTSVAIVTGGSSDVPVAKEAWRTLDFYGVVAEEIYDVGVAGLWRVEEKLETLRRKDIIICVAGMDAALPTVLGGLVSALIVAVPSSVGYGVANGGETALRALLCSCAQGLVVVNIDNGFGAACAALRVLER